LLEREVITNDPSVLILLPKTGKKLPKNILTIKQMNKLLLTPDIKSYLGLRDRAIMELLYATAIRNSELRTLKLQDLNLKEGEIFIYQGQGGKDRIVPLGKIAKEFLELYLEKARPILCKQINTPQIFPL
jgi:integrase/recombinase XerD